MNRDELLKMLDLEGKEATPIEAPEPATPSTKKKLKAPGQPTALELDEWGLRRGREVLHESARLQELSLGELAVADFFGAAFEVDPRLHESCIDPQRHEFLKQLLETPEYQALHTSTRLHSPASALAACAFAEEFAKLPREKNEDKKEEEEDPPAAVEREMATLRAVGRALLEATKEVEEAEEAVRAIGMGPGCPGSNDPQAIAALYRRVRSSPTLKRICELAGRYRRVAMSKQRQKATHGLDDLIGVTLDGELSRVLPSELARLAIPELEDDVLRRLVERQVQCREYRGLEPVGKGPIVVVVDESGSMEGGPVHTAKALALALAWIARQQHRWTGLVAYSGDTGHRLLSLPPGRWNEMALVEWLEQFLGRGSTLDLPIRELPDYYRRLCAPPGQTDLILITDAICRLEPVVCHQFNLWRATVQARVISLVLGSRAGDLTGISDEIHELPTLAVTEAGVERVLSI